VKKTRVFSCVLSFLGDYSFFTGPRFLEMIFKIVSEKTIIGKIYHDFSMISKREKWIYFADNAMIIQLQ
jgi:hypothetical protein